MIHDLNNSLKVILQHELPTPLNEQVAISFDPPDDQFPPPSVTRSEERRVGKEC